MAVELPIVLVSGCLVGVKCRYDGSSCGMSQMIELLSCCLPVSICPEILAGLPTPRPPVEEVDGCAMTVDGEDQTIYFSTGAEMTLRIAQRLGAKYALLKSGSPSCGCDLVYDGTFSDQLISGMGFTARLLKKNQVTVFSENQIDELWTVISNGRHF